MDHDDALALIETAAAEPGGLDRLMAGDTPDAALLAGHLADCHACTEELRRIGQTAQLVRTVVREQPSPELKERTLAYVRQVGRPRGEQPAAASVAAPALVGAAAASSSAPAVATRRAPRRWPRGLGLAATVGMSAVLAAGVAVAVVGVDRGAAEQQYEDTIEALAKVNVWTFRVDGEPDAQRVALAKADGSPGATLVFSPGTTDLVVVANDLAQPPAGQEYRCWVEIDGQRQRVGKMFFGGGLAYWAGPVPAAASATDGTRFGISLAPIDAPGTDAEPVMVGEL
jgi:hypothetical protein